MLLGHMTKQKNSGWRKDESLADYRKQMDYDTLTATWRKASSLLASFDGELAWSMHSTYSRAGQMHVHGDNRYKNTHVNNMHAHT